MANLKNTSEVIIKKSKFFGYLFELSDASEVKGILEELKKSTKSSLTYATPIKLVPRKNIPTTASRLAQPADRS